MPQCCGEQSASSRWRHTPAADGQASHQRFCSDRLRTEHLSRLTARPAVSDPRRRYGRDRCGIPNVDRRRSGADSTGGARRVADPRSPVPKRPPARDAVLALRVDGRHPRPRHRVREPATPGRARPVRIVSRSGGRPGRRRRLPPQDRLAVPAVPRTRRVAGARHRASPHGRRVAWPLAWRAGVHQEVLRPASDSDRHARPARRRRGDGRPATRRGLGHRRLHG